MNEIWKGDFEARLRSIEWSQLSHAYGDADEVPGLLLQLLDEGTFEEAIYELCGNLWHQGTRYEATLKAIPFLVELLEHSPVQRGQVINYLLQVAVADTLWHYPQGYRPELGVGSYMSQEFADELYACVQNLAFPVFLRFAQEEDGEEQQMALWALGWFPAREGESRPILEVSQMVAASFSLRMLDASKLPFRERTEEEEIDREMEEYDELMGEISS